MRGDRPDAPEPTVPHPDKKAYTPPRLTIHGTVEQLTGTKPLGSSDTAFSGLDLSDYNAKEHFSPVAPRDILDRLADLQVQTWNYKDEDPSIRHIGPMAQDFAATFGVGADDRHIHVVDANGVAFAAIQALNQVVEQQATELETLRSELDTLERRAAVTSL